MLPNGKLLVAGGAGTALLASAELYDPANGAWTATNATTKRYLHTATLLLNGKVLIAGGLTGSSLNSAELYDPATETSTPTGSLATSRYNHTATLLPNGEVLVAGGNNAINFMEASAELYDPASGTWTSTGSLEPGRFDHTATLLPDGTVLAAGGIGIELPIGAVLTIINNTATTPIAGTFTNLPEGAQVFGRRAFQVSYKGGDGNDLTLTAVPSK